MRFYQLKILSFVNNEIKNERMFASLCSLQEKRLS